MTDQPDSVLLQQWARRQDAEAFNELVSRYANQVYATCRRVLRNEADAEDVSQECFLRLAQRPMEVRSSLGGWLHRVATTRSLERIRKDARRGKREQVYQAQQPQAQTTTWDDVRSCIDEAIEALPEDQRTAVIAHFLHRKTHAAVAGELDLTPRQVRYLIEKGVASVRETLHRQGVTVAVAALAGFLTTRTADAAPATLTASLGKVAIGGANAAAAMGLKSLVSAKGILLAATTVAVIVIGVLLTRQAGSDAVPVQALDTGGYESPAVEASSAALASSEPQPRPAQNAQEPAAPAKAVPVQEPETTDEPEPRASLSGRVIDESGEPVPDARITCVPLGSPDEFESANAGDEDAHLTRAIMDRSLHKVSRTGPDGTFHFEQNLPAGATIIAAEADGYDGDQSDGRLLEPGAHVDDMVFVMKHGRMKEGRVITWDNRPVTDAVLFVDPGMTFGDKNGRFTFGLAPDAENAAFLVLSKTLGMAGFEDLSIDPAEPWILQFPRPATLSGSVRHEDGSPATGYRVRILAYSMPLAEATVDAEGNYRIEQVPDIGPNKERVGVVSPEGLRVFDRLRLDKLSNGLNKRWDYVLPAAISVSGRLTGMPSRKPVAGHRIVCKRGSSTIASAVTDSDGRYTFDIRTGDGDYAIYATPSRHAESPLSRALRAGQSYVVDLTRVDGFTISARFVDVDGEPVTDGRVSAYACDNGAMEPKLKDLGVIEPDETGTYTCDRMPDGCSGLLSFYGKRYVDGISTLRTGSPGQSFPLETLTLYRHAPIRGRVLGPDGTPIGGGRVTAVAHLQDGTIESYLLPVLVLRSMDTFALPDGAFKIDSNIPATRLILELRYHDKEFKAFYAWQSDWMDLSNETTTDLGDIIMQPTEREHVSMPGGTIVR